MMRTRTLPPFHPLSSIPPTAAEKEEIQRDNEVLAEILSLREEEFLALASFRDGKEDGEEGRIKDSLANFIRSFLRYSPRPHELMVEGEKWTEKDVWFASYTALLQRTRQILLRIPPEDIRSILSIPALLDACSLWGGGGIEGRVGSSSRSTITTELDQLAERLGKEFIGLGMREIAPHAATSLLHLCQKVQNDKGSQMKQLTALEIIDLSFYVADALTSLSWLLSCHSVSSDVTSELLHETTFLPALSNVYEVIIPSLEKGMLSVEPLQPYISVLKEARKGALRLCYLIYHGMREQGGTPDDVFNAIISLANDERKGYLLDGDIERGDYLTSFISTTFDESSKQQRANHFSPEFDGGGGGIGSASTTTVPPTTTLSGTSTIQNSSSSNIPSQDDVTKMIQDIQAIVGKPSTEYPLGVGSGYAQALLATMDWSVERVLEAILEDHIPESLIDVPRALEGAWIGYSGVNDKGYQKDEDANRITLERAKMAELEEEKKKFALEHIPNESLSVIGDWLGEYDDDYNDVYDECEPSGMVAEAGTVLGDVESMLQYNRAVRMAEEEATFWEGMTNMNRNNTEKDLHDEGDGSADLLPDNSVDKTSSLAGLAARYEANRNKKKKVKSGHMATTMSAEVRNKDSSNNSSSMKKKMAIQRRRKEKNKAGIANHHRKDRASRKGAF